MEIFIPSSGRPSKQTTFDNLPKGLQDRAIIVVPKDELTSYSKYPAQGIDVRGIGPTRQWCVDEAKDKMVMLDDDLVFSTRREDKPTLFRNPTDAELYALFDDIEEQLTDYAHVSVATREGGNRNTNRFYYSQRALRVLAYETRWLKKLGVRFDRMTVMEDFDVTLNLLSKGHANIILNYMVQNQNGSNLAGGCSQYRTEEVQATGARMLAKFWPDYVKVVTKQPKTAWDGKPRTDVVIQWKKCYNDSPNKP
jgi:hypothetical protein